MKWNSVLVFYLHKDITKIKTLKFINSLQINFNHFTHFIHFIHFRHINYYTNYFQHYSQNFSNCNFDLFNIVYYKLNLYLVIKCCCAIYFFMNFASYESYLDQNIWEVYHLQSSLFLHHLMESLSKNFLK